jgi:hypothetical protein
VTDWNSEASLPRLARAFAAVLIAIMATPAYAQNQTITLSEAPPVVRSAAFTTTVAEPLKKGSYPAWFVLGGCTSVWTVRMHTFESGERTLRYPVHGIVNCSRSNSEPGFSVFASTTVMGEDEEPGEAVRSGDYLIQTSQGLCP